MIHHRVDKGRLARGDPSRQSENAEFFELVAEEVDDEAGKEGGEEGVDRVEDVLGYEELSMRRDTLTMKGSM